MLFKYLFALNGLCAILIVYLQMIPEVVEIMKSSLVSYHTTPYKALSLPPSGQAAVFDDFCCFGSGEVAELRTVVKMYCSDNELVIDVDCLDDEPEKINACNTPGSDDLWAGDLLELFFGAIAPEPWQIQLCVGAGGGRFDSQGCYSQWRAECSVSSCDWHAEIHLPLSFLKIQDLSVGFNICRQNPARSAYYNWALLKNNFHETENYGEIFFCSYDTAFLAKCNALPPAGGLSRQSFEQTVAAQMVPAWQVSNGPFLLNPDCGRVSINWATAGMCAAMVEYRLQGTEEWRVCNIDECNGVLEQDHTCHRAELEDLQENAVYEYRLKSLVPVSLEEKVFPADGSVYAFKTFGRGCGDFSFGICSDLHSNNERLRLFLQLKEFRNCDFFVLLGDLLSHISGHEAFYTGLLDSASELYARNRPLVFVRGNHEQVGLFTGSYSLMQHFTNRTHYMFQQGNCCFAVLDVGSDHPDDAVHRNEAMVRAQQDFLADAARSAMWKNADFRIILIHIPPADGSFHAQKSCDLLAALPEDAPQPDLLIGGHYHKYFRLTPNEEPFTPLGKVANSDLSKKHPFTVIANDVCTALRADISGKTLQITAVTESGDIIDRYSITSGS